ncbi:MAG TPA: helix-turn-helix domain-containing protein, partial [Nitrosopumilaceae archaeon]|nr:helix-turn-helix domain-containing protein [Nitrosopumilaceae archaeon]
SERDLLYKVLFDMKKDMTDLKKIVHDIVQYNNGQLPVLSNDDLQVVNRLYKEPELENGGTALTIHQPGIPIVNSQKYAEPIVIEESLSLQDREVDMIIKALQKHKGKRKHAAKELGISERTLYRKINEYNINE